MSVYQREDLFCGCAFVQLKAGGSWFQVVSCPDHAMDTRPQDEPKASPRRSS
jgi:hypothetical protein